MGLYKPPGGGIGGGGPTLSNANPLSNLITPTPGTAAEAARADHRHPIGGVFHQRFTVWHLYGTYSPLGSNPSMNTGDLHATPFLLATTQAFDGIACHVNFAGAGVTRLGVYRDNGGGYPGALLGQYGTVDVGTAGIKIIVLAPALTLEPGFYWLAGLIETTSNASYGATNASSVGLRSATNSLSASIAGFFATGVAAGALPATYPATLNAGQSIMRVALRAA
jgi:hypothetical protein